MTRTSISTTQGTATQQAGSSGSNPRPSFPVSVKGVVVRDGHVVLLKNERDEWELPGGRLEHGETPEQCVVREIQEETGWNVEVGPLLDAWVYHVLPSRDVFVVTYGCYTETTDEPVRSFEHTDLGLFTEQEIPGLHMPEHYRQAIVAWFDRLHAEQPG